ncbi:hypothetical protein NKJ26_06240 [Mesorhizobium sp. M0152]|uniref:hypothetical protein n=1 Tax=Mesorhizobium sp. M0152 TaxID=2956898 RepID=UPI00333DAE61
MDLANGHFAGDARKIGGLDADIGTVRIAHRVKQRERRAISLVFLRARPGEHFSEETHGSGSDWSSTAVNIVES